MKQLTYLLQIVISVFFNVFQFTSKQILVFSPKIKGILTNRLSYIYQACHNTILYFDRIISFLCEKLIKALRFSKRSWILLNRESVSKLFFYFIFILEVSLLAIVFIGILEFYKHTASSSIINAGKILFQMISIKNLMICLASILILWLSLSFLVKQVLLVLFFSQTWISKPFDYVIKLLSSLPTLILGNSVIVFSDTIGIHPKSTFEVTVFILFALTLIGLPTALQLGQEILKDQDRKQMQQAIALGINKVVIGRRMVLPNIHRSFNAIITLAMSRIIIEGYIIFNRTIVGTPVNSKIIRDSQDFLDVFRSLYSTMTIQSNIVLILILFFVAIVLNVWFFNISSVQKV